MLRRQCLSEQEKRRDVAQTVPLRAGGEEMLRRQCLSEQERRLCTEYYSSHVHHVHPCGTMPPCTPGYTTPLGYTLHLAHCRSLYYTPDVLTEVHRACPCGSKREYPMGRRDSAQTVLPLCVERAKMLRVVVPFL